MVVGVDVVVVALAAWAGYALPSWWINIAGNRPSNAALTRRACPGRPASPWSKRPCMPPSFH